MMLTALPLGRPGRIVALAATALVLAAIWIAAVQPLLDWYDDGEALLSNRRALAGRMGSLAGQVPDLARRAAALGAQGDPSSNTLTGDTDAIAGAKLQEVVQSLASAHGLTPASIENLPAVPSGRYRRIALQLTLVARYPALIDLLQAFEQATPRMLIDDLHVESAHMVNQPVDLPLQAQFTVIGFRNAGP